MKAREERRGEGFGCGYFLTIARLGPSAWVGLGWVRSYDMGGGQWGSATEAALLEALNWMETN